MLIKSISYNISPACDDVTRTSLSGMENMDVTFVLE